MNQAHWLNPTRVISMEDGDSGSKTAVIVHRGTDRQLAGYDVWINVDQVWYLAKHDLRLRRADNTEIKRYCGRPLDRFIEWAVGECKGKFTDQNLDILKPILPLIITLGMS